MNKHELKNCKRCSTSFECKVGDISNCECSEIILNKDTKKFLEKTAFDCICKKCLIELNHLVEKTTESKFPLNHRDLVEGIHFYFEEQKLVYTEFYLMQRGFCCKLGCRNCAYGFEN
jgi:hypothetical protein